MSEVTIKLKDYKASGVYFIEEDNSIKEGTTNAAIRIAVGFNEKGVFNRPVYMSGTADCDEMLGDIDRRLENKQCFTNRNIRTMVAKAPVYALNLIKVDESDSSTNPDVVGFSAVSLDAGQENINGKTPFKNMFNRSKFWITDPSTMMDAVANAVNEDEENPSDAVHAPLFAFGNCGTQDMSLIVRKAEGLTGYNVTFLDWYGSEDAIPYSWINPYDYVSDYFIEVIAVKGDFTNYDVFKSDIVWKEYFDGNGLKRDKVNKFLRLDAVTVVGNWIGCIIPDFYDNQGKCKSIDYLINKSKDTTGLMFGFNSEALDLLAYDKTNIASNEDPAPKFFIDIDGDGEMDEETEKAPYGIDMTGAGVTIAANNEEQTGIKFLSYDIEMSAGENGTLCTLPASYKGSDSCEFTVDSAIFDSSSNDAFVPALGDYVRAKNGTLAKIIKKRATKGDNESILYTFTATAPVFFDNLNLGTYAVLDDANIDNDGETNPENLGYQDYMVYGNNDNSTDGEVKQGNVEIHKNFVNVYTNLKFIPLKGLKIGNRHRPGFDAQGNINIEAGIEKIYSMLKDPAIRKGLLNDEMIDFRYIVDTMGGGLGTELRGKMYLADLAKAKGHCLAVLNAPAMSDFAKSTAPMFCDDYIAGEAKPMFNVKYIPQGGNQDHAYTMEYQEFSLPTEGNGAKNAAVFSPFLKYKQGVKDILVPPAADVCNTLMTKFLGGDPYKTNANLNGILDNPQISGLEFDYDEEDRGYVEPFGFNPIIMRGTTPVIYGDRTAYQTVDSDYNFLHVRELLNTIEIRCKAVLGDYVFTYNNPQTRSEIYTRVNPILSAMKDSGALAKYDMQIDENNNTEEVIDEKFCILDIGIWVTPNMEKVLARVKVNRGSKA